MYHACLAAFGRHIVIQPLHDCITVYCIRGHRIAPALAPSFNLPLNITFGAPECIEASLNQIHGVQLTQHIEKIKQLLPNLIRTHIQARRILATNHQAFDVCHQIKITAQHVMIFTEMNGNRPIGIDFLQSRENLVLARHIMSRLYLTAKWRSA